MDLKTINAFVLKINDCCNQPHNDSCCGMGGDWNIGGKSSVCYPYEAFPFSTSPRLETIFFTLAIPTNIDTSHQYFCDSVKAFMFYL